MNATPTPVRSVQQEIGPMLRLAGPVILSELGWMAMGLVDIAMVGRLGPVAIGAIGIGNVIFIAVGIVAVGLLLGLDTLVSQAYGAGRIDRCRRALVQGLYLAVVMSPLLMAVVRFAAGRLGALGVDPAVLPLAVAYLDAVVWSLPPLLLHTACRRYLQAMGVVRPVTLALIVANGINAAANWVLVYGRLGAPALGVVGSGWSTVLARVCMALIPAVAVLLDGRERWAGLPRISLWPDRNVLAELLRLGWPAASQLVLEIGVFGVATMLAGRLGAIALAAHEIAMNVCGLTFMVPLGVSSAGAVRVGQALGRGDPHAAGRAGWTALGVGEGFMSLAALAFLVAPRAILGAFTSDAAVVATGTPLLRIAAMFQLFDGLQVVSTGILRGAGDTRTPMALNIVAHWGLGLPIAAGLAFAAGWGIIGLWLGLCTGLIVLGLSLLAAWIVKGRGLRSMGHVVPVPAPR
jgi:MATE family multidrug resistance protein